MTDFTKLNSKPWCPCCSNEQAFRAAEEVCDYVVQKYYAKPMCIGSINTVMTIAQFMMEFVVAAKVGHDLARSNPAADAILNDGQRRDIGGQILQQEKEVFLNDVCEHMQNVEDVGAKWEKAFIKRMIAAKELAEADEAFNKQSKPT